MTPPYKATVRKHIYTIHGPPKTELFVYRDVIIPFPPFIGLDLWDGEWSSGPIKEITWDFQLNEFYCCVEDEDPGSFDPALNISNLPIEDMVEKIIGEYTYEGWVRGYFPPRTNV